MKKVIDNFSDQSTAYKKYRPEYPEELYQFILSISKERNACWDCGTGNGQVAKELSKHFKKVSATDISEKQLQVAAKRSNIEYQVIRSERTAFSADQFDLITVAQAVHWFDQQRFNAEVKRVGRSGSKICVWGYGLLRIDKEIDPVISKFYHDTVGPYWNKERDHIDAEYKSIEFDFDEVETPKDLCINAHWSVDELIGYLNSWSSVQNYKQQNDGQDPVELVTAEISRIWKRKEINKIEFPLFMRVGLIEK